RSRRVSATTSEPKPGALVPAGFGRSIAAISGCAVRPAASGLDFAMGGSLSRAYVLGLVGAWENSRPIQYEEGAGRNCWRSATGGCGPSEFVELSSFVLSGGLDRAERHCERSEAISLHSRLRSRLLRCARNDSKSASIEFVGFSSFVLSAAIARRAGV